MSAESPEYSSFFAVMGASAAMVFSGNYHDDLFSFSFSLSLSLARSLIVLYKHLVVIEMATRVLLMPFYTNRFQQMTTPKLVLKLARKCRYWLLNSSYPPKMLVFIAVSRLSNFSQLRVPTGQAFKLISLKLASDVHAR